MNDIENKLQDIRNELRWTRILTAIGFAAVVLRFLTI